MFKVHNNICHLSFSAGGGSAFGGGLGTSKKSGQAVIVAVIFFTSISLLLIANGVNRVSVEARRLRDLESSTTAFFASEAGLEEAILRIKKGWLSVASVPIGPYAAVINVSSVGQDKEVTSTSTVSSANRVSKTRLVQGVGSDFSYGVQVGEDGLDMGTDSRVEGNVYANGSITGGGGSVITGSASAVGTISNPPSVAGTRTQGASSQPMPPFDVQYWKDLATAGGTLSGNQTYSGDINQIGPKKINGNVTVNGKLQVSGPLYITGNLTNDGEISIHSSLGNQGTVILVDGSITFKESSIVLSRDTGNTPPKVYLLFVTTKSGGGASDIKHDANIQAIVYAPNGEIDLVNSAHVTAMLGKKVKLEPNAVVNYDIGLPDMSFSTGPSGGWNISSWQEI